jgi:hypothetical protein
MQSDVLVGKLAVRDLIDISTGKIVPNVYVDSELSRLHMAYRGTRFIRRLVRPFANGIESVKKSFRHH